MTAKRQLDTESIEIRKDANMFGFKRDGEKAIRQSIAKTEKKVQDGKISAREGSRKISETKADAQTKFWKSLK